MFRTNTRNIETKQWISSTKQRIGLLAALMFFALGAWGQDYSGVYYIASNGNSDTPSSYSYNANNPANNYYLRPAADPQLSDSSDAYYDRTIATMPFLTTNKTSHNDIAVWIVQSTGDGYYNVIHAASGKYVVYRPFFSGTNSRRKAMHLEECATPPEEAKFEINSDTYNNDVSIYFRPISVSSGHCNWNIADKNQPYNYGTGSSLYYGGLIGLYQKDGNGHININSRFKFEPYQVAAPEISFNYATKEVTVTCNTPGALIYCTTNGNLPTTELTPHTSPYTFTQTTPCTVRAIAEKFTAITEATPLVLQQVSTPTIQADETLNYITITSETEGATIYFTNDGTEPTIASFLYTSPLNFTFSEKPIKAIAVKTNMFNSDVASNSIKIKCPKPEIYPDFETNLVNLFCDAEAASIYYTLDGTTPTTNSTLYDGTPFPLPMSGTVKAFATGLPNCLDSDVSTYTITKAATPTIQADNGEAPRYITITTTTIGADIYYTIDGSDPTTESIRYTGPFREGPEHAHVSGVDIKAIAVKPGMFCSEVGNGNVTLTCDPPLISRIGASTFEISSTFPVVGANIYYTTDETEPTTSSTLYSGPFTHGVPCTIKAIVVANGYYDSPKAERSFGSDLEQVDGIYLIQNDYDYTLFVAKANTTAGASGHYKLVANISAAGTSMVTTTFTGLFEGSADADGNFYTISDLDHPMFREINPGITDGTIPTDQGIVRNVILKDVNIANHEGNTGAIACEIRGGACIYNCGILSGSVGGTGNVGGLVGVLDYTVYDYNAGLKYHAFTRVLNCFSYANITQKGADNGTSDNSVWAAGIVGNNKYESKVHNYPFDPNNPKDCKLKTAVINCMFYGDITTRHGVNIAPVFGFMRMSNLEEKDKAINRYDYFLDESLRILAIEAPLTSEEFRNMKTEDVVERLFEAAMDSFKRKMDNIANVANPVIKRVYEEQGEHFQNIIIPITDGKVVYNIPVNLKEAYETEGKAIIKSFERGVMLHNIDEYWKRHLREMDELRNSVQNASYEQKDPLLIYKLESFNLYGRMQTDTNFNTVSVLMRAQIPVQQRAPENVREAAPEEQEDRSQYVENRSEAPARGPQPPRRIEPVRAEPRVGRNDPCPCGSGKKFKNCHGRGL